MKDKRVTPILSAEVFDESDKMIDKYNIEMVEGDYAEDYSMPEAGPAPYVRYFLPVVDGVKELFTGDLIATGVSGEYWVVDKL